MLSLIYFVNFFPICPSLLQTLINLYGPNGPYNFSCTPLDYSENEISLSVVRYSWLYFMLKFVDLLDTVRICFAIAANPKLPILNMSLFHIRCSSCSGKKILRSQACTCTTTWECSLWLGERLSTLQVSWP